MAVNPLFSGPGQSSRNRQHRLPPVHHSQSNYQFTSSLHTQEFEMMDSAVPRKKLRLNSGGTMDTDQDEDPFEDFEESFTADDLEAIDMIASQALSQAPPNSTNSFRKVGSSTSSRYPSVKQFNNAKAQKGLHPSNGAKVERPVAPNVLRPREHPVQTNLNIPFHQIKNRPVKTPSSQVITTGNIFSKKKSAAGGVDGNVRDELTPPKGTTAVDSSARPGGPQDEFSPVQKLQQEVERYKAETEHLNQKLNALKSEKCRKDGEIEVLRQNLTKAQTDISKLQIERIQKDEEKQREQANKEKQLEQEVEALKTQLEFKDREIIETQTSLRNLQQRTNSNCPSPRKSPRLVPVSSPSRKAFPTKSSFMTGSTKQQHNQRSPVAAKGGSPLKNQSKPTKTKSPGSSVSPRRTLSGLLIKTWNPPAIGAALQLKTRVLNGCMTPSVMIGLLMKNEDESTEVNKSQSSSNLFDMFSNQADSVEPQDVSHDLTYSSAQRIACEAISSLLTSGKHEAQSLSLPLPNHPVVPATPALSEHHLAKLIPVIQDQLDHYLQELESLMERTRSRPTVSESTSHPDIEEQYREETVVECRSKMLVPGLRSLRKLCCHSESICKMITAGCDQIQNAMDTSADEIDPSAPITFTQSSSRGRSSSDHPCLAEWMKEPCRIVQLLQDVLKLHPVKGHPCQTVRESGWGVISALCRNSGDSELKWCYQCWQCLHVEKQRVECMQHEDRLSTSSRFDNPQDCSRGCIPFLVHDGFVLALCTTISTMDTYKSALAVATAVSRSVSVCSQSDSCPLSHIYQLVTSLKSSGDNSDDEITAVRHELIGLLLTIVSNQVNGANSLVETNCHCTYEVVSSVVFMMLEELKLADIDKEVMQRRWFLLKQGLLFLHVVIIQTRAITEQKVESEMELMNLVVRLHRFLRRASEMDKSQACMLQDIWECVAGDDDVWEEDELEDENEMMEQD